MRTSESQKYAAKAMPKFKRTRKKPNPRARKICARARSQTSATLTLTEISGQEFHHPRGNFFFLNEDPGREQGMPRRKRSRLPKSNRTKLKKWTKYPKFIYSSNDSDFQECDLMSPAVSQSPPKNNKKRTRKSVASPAVSPIRVCDRGI